MSQYFILDTGKIIDTGVLLPHVECYLVMSGNLVIEYIDGYQSCLGKIVGEFDYEL